MKEGLRKAFEDELANARRAEQNAQLGASWRHLERAHILSQRDAGAHVHVHLLMLAFGYRRRDAHEVMGQVARLCVAAPGSWLGRAPVGNTGGANVGIFKPMPIPEDLQRLLAEDAAASY